MPQARQFLTAEQFLLTTLVVKLAVMAALATMLVRLPAVPAHPDLRAARLARPADLRAQPRHSADRRRRRRGCCSNYNAADLTLEGAFLAGLIAGPYAGAIVGAHGRHPAARRRRVDRAAVRRRLRLRRRRPARALSEGSDLALLAVRLHRACTAASGRWCGALQVDWQVMLLLAPIALELLRQALGARWSEHHRLFYLRADPLVDAGASSLLATVLVRRDADQDLEQRAHRAPAAGAGKAAAGRARSRRSPTRSTRTSCSTR